MGGRGKRGKAPTNNRGGGAGRGSAPPPQFNPAPNPPQSAWGRPAPAAAPPPAQSAWGAPAPAPIPAQSAWGRPAPAPAPAAAPSPRPSPAATAAAPPAQSAWSRPAPAPAATAPPPPTQSAWSRPTPASAPSPVNGQLSSRAPEASGINGRPRDEAQQSRQQPGAQRQPREYVGYNGATARRPDRGSVRDRKVLYPDVVVTKDANVSKKGSTGKVVSLTTNYFRLLKRPDWQIYQYRVDFSPPIEQPGFMKKLIYEQKKNLGGYLFDGTILFLCKKLHNNVTEFMTKDRDGNPIQITVKFVKLMSMFNGESIQVLNLILRRSMAGLNLQLVGRNFYDALARIKMNALQIELWPGYNTSIRQHEVDILMCADVTTKVMRTETIYDMLLIHRNSNNYKQNLSNAILGMTVLTSYNNKTHKIVDISFDLSPMEVFDGKDGPTTFVDYYRNKYNLTIRDVNQPMLIVKSTQRSIRAGQPEFILLVPELCRATGFTDKMRSDRRAMEDVAIYTRLSPSDRINKLMAFNKRLQSTADSMTNFAEWNFRLDNQLVQLNGRELPVERVLFGNNQDMIGDDWTNGFRSKPMYSQKDLLNWIIITPSNRANQAGEFVRTLQQAATGMKYTIKPPHRIEMKNDTTFDLSNALKSAVDQNPQLIMCILSNLKSDMYSIIKKTCCVAHGVPSQVMLGRTITPKPGKPQSTLLSVGTKVAIQINAKLGGAPWMVNIPTTGIMVVGFDVCHDTNDKKKSYGAMVATMDMKSSAKYFSAVSEHKNGEEMSNSFALNMAKALKAYLENHKCLPSRIFIYRDGVGEGQTDYVREFEIEAIQKQLKIIYGDRPYKLLFAVVSKRINTRFFRAGTNPMPGTVIDDVVTLPERHDFYMISPKVTRGTVSPTNYNILFNTSGLSSDEIQKFTFKMTYLYYNWSSTLAVPAVCQYAHKLAFLVGNFIHQAPNSALEQQLYFL